MVKLAFLVDTSKNNTRNCIFFNIFRQKSLPVQKECLPLHPSLNKMPCPDGGIGRRAGLKHQCRKACRFDPGSGYKKGET